MCILCVSRRRCACLYSYILSSSLILQVNRRPAGHKRLKRAEQGARGEQDEAGLRNELFGNEGERPWLLEHKSHSVALIKTSRQIIMVLNMRFSN